MRFLRLFFTIDIAVFYNCC